MSAAQYLAGSKESPRCSAHGALFRPRARFARWRAPPCHRAAPACASCAACSLLPRRYVADGELPLTQTVLSSASRWQPAPLTAVAGVAGAYEARVEVADGATLEYRFAVNGEEFADKCNPPSSTTSTDASAAASTAVDGGELYSSAAVACGAPDALPSGGVADGSGEADGGDGGDAGSSDALVELFEWPYLDVAAECATLGAQRWAGVLLAPPARHVTLSPAMAEALQPGAVPPPVYAWWARGAPLDLLELESRAGTEVELAAAVAACASHGVRVWAQVHLNHLARPRCCNRAYQAAQPSSGSNSSGSSGGGSSGSSSGGDAEADDGVVPTCTELGLPSTSAGTCPELLLYPASALGAASFHRECAVTFADYSDVASLQVLLPPPIPTRSLSHQAPQPPGASAPPCWC